MNEQWDKVFFKTIQHILMTERDPIGVKDSINAEDEYDSYAMRVYSYLAAGWSADQLAFYLADNEYAAMGLERRTHEGLRPVAEHLIAEWEKFSGPKSAP